MIDSITIENFRGVRVGAVEALSPLSILVGPNNCGKSTVLEAVLMAASAPDARTIASTLMRRGGPRLHALQHAFRGSSVPIELAIRVGGQRMSCEIGLPETQDVERIGDALRDGLAEPMEFVRVVSGPHRSSVFVDGARFSVPFIEAGNARAQHPGVFVDVETVTKEGALEDAYAEIREHLWKVRVIDALRSSFTGLTDLEPLKQGKDWVLYTFAGPDVVPAYAAGDGFKRFLQVAAALAGAKAGAVLLLEEPECFQHSRYMRELALLLLNAAESGTQVILSTHSIELIDLLIALRPEDAPFPTAHRLRLVDHELHCTSLSSDLTVAARNELLEDLRS